MAFSHHSRKLSEGSKPRLLSDTYFEKKQNHKRTSSLTRDTSIEKPYILNEKKNSSNMKDCLKQIIENISMLSKQTRKQEKQLLLVFAVIIDNDCENLTDSEISRKLVTSEFLLKLRVFTSTMALSLKNQNRKTVERIHKAYKIYSDINFTLYGYSIIKLVLSFIEKTFDVFGLRYKKVKIIDYFDEAPVDKKIRSTSLKKYIEQKNIPDPQYETTKDDEEFIYTNPDIRDYEGIFDHDIPIILQTEPDYKEILQKKFLEKHSAVNPYNFKKKQEIEKKPFTNVMKMKAFDGPKGSKVEKLNKFNSRLKMFRKFEDKFVDFMVKKCKGRYRADEINDWVKVHKNNLIDEFLGELKKDNEIVSENKSQGIYTHFHEKKIMQEMIRRIRDIIKSL
ncbi:hypothetical protein SteCoe_8556 [Stentor coeruleus]|uniref:Uncharacterized protein n=1 Tax=Stentor coeruleus TaxID=5963 RepID=A0A1R2CK38_9CILI|nr:hypothetical protein SteCoe_8556 [Stentor coeruleus]